MKKRMLSLFCMCMALFGTAATDAAEIDISVMKPWVNSNIKGVVTDDVTADIRDDFYLAVNHDWLRDTEFYPGRPWATPWTQATNRFPC